MKYRVKYMESERGCGQDYWETHYDSYEEARDAYMSTNAKLPKDMVPDYYIQAESLEYFDKSKGKWFILLQ